MVELRRPVGTAAVILAGCVSTVSPLARDDASHDAVDATAMADASAAMDAHDTSDVSDAQFPRPDVDPACPPTPPRPGRCARVGLACAYPNGCSYRCDGLNDAGPGAWFTRAACF